MAEILDRSLITVPDLDLDDAYSHRHSVNSHSDDESGHHRLRTTAMGLAAQR